MTTKLKIDLNKGLLEVEGSEAFVRNIYADFKTHFAGIEMTEESQPKRRSRRTRTTTKFTTATQATNSAEPLPDKAESAPAPIPEPTPPSAPNPATAVAQKAKPTLLPSPYTYLADLDLTASQDRPSLVDFMDSKLPITNEEHNIVFLYYLQHLLNLKTIQIDHLYTCYRAAKIRAPINIENTLDQRGWVKVGKNGNLTLSAAGKSYVEGSLPKKLKG